MAEFKYEYVNPANPFISGIKAIKDRLREIGSIKIGKDERLREIRYLVGQTHFSEEGRVKNVDKYIASLLDENRVDTPELEKLRDVVAEIGFALQEQKTAIPANQLENYLR